MKKSNKDQKHSYQSETDSDEIQSTNEVNEAAAAYLHESPYQSGLRIISFKPNKTNFKDKSDTEVSASKNIFKVGVMNYSWSNELEKIQVIRSGISYQSIEVISKKLGVPIKFVLSLLGMPQTTYNKKKAEKALLDERYSELILLLNDLLNFGLSVFNNEEEKFHRWLKKPNLSIGGIRPNSLLDTIIGINEVRYSLNRLEYGNFA